MKNDTAIDGRIDVSRLEQVVRDDQCIGCGFCLIPTVADEHQGHSGSISMQWSESLEHWVPRCESEGSTSPDPRICPGASMSMPRLSAITFGRNPGDVMLGEVISIHAGFSADQAVRENSASGGITSSVLAYLLESGEIDFAYCAVAANGPYDSRGRMISDPADLAEAAGSHYHPVNFGSALAELGSSTGNFAFVGLPCEVAAMRQLLEYRADLKQRCKLIIGLFCGGINRFDSGIGYYLRANNVQPETVEYIDYRAGSWPGHIRLRTRDGEERTIARIKGNTRYNILKYVIGFQGYAMLPRCRICPDQIADFADIAVGDPHLARFKSSDSPGWSAILTRTKLGDRIVNQLAGAKRIHLEPLSREEVIESQGYTLENRRHANVYVKVSNWLGMHPPSLQIYDDLEKTVTRHQHVYAFVDLLKIKLRKLKWLRPFYLPLQIFEYLFLTFSPRLFLSRIRKLTSNK